MTRNDTINFILQFYYNSKTPVHITLNSGTWLNGIIIELGSDYLILQEEVFGKMPIKFEQIKDDGVSPYKRK